MSHFILSILSARCLLLLHCFLLLLALCAFLNFNNILSARFERYSEQAIHFIPKSTRETEHDMKMLNSGKEWCQLSQANN